MMKIKDGASVYTADGQGVGRIDRVVLDPRTNEITHLVVREGWLFTEDKVVPVSLVDDAKEARVLLRADVENLDELPMFEETYYVSSDDTSRDNLGRDNLGRDNMGRGELATDAPVGATTGATAAAAGGYAHAPGIFWYPPMGALWSGYYGGYYGYPVSNYVGHTEQNIPEGTVGLKEGADVYSADGEHVGKVDEVLTNDELSRATHLRISEGWLFKEKRVVPVDWIRDVREEEIDLAVRSEVLHRVPAQH
jgi:uncharacterized protein YrrD